jgi:hypothetical protein
MGLLLIGFLVVGVVVIVFLKEWTQEEARTEARLRSPETHTIAYVVPEGQDPAILMAALAHVGFESMVDTAGPRERLLVACEETDRAQVRDVLEHVDRAGFSGPEMHAGHVHFDDEA